MRALWKLPLAADTVQLGAALGRSCRWDDQGPRLVYLSGDLGAGKTTLAAAVLEELGATETVHSPSYALVESYALRQGSGVHVDCYRLLDAGEFEQLGLRDYFAPRTLWLVEWPERAGSALPPPDLSVSLRVEGGGRSADIEAMSDAGCDWLARIQHALPSQSCN